jgi:hypothetical protein
LRLDLFPNLLERSGMPRGSHGASRTRVISSTRSGSPTPGFLLIVASNDLRLCLDDNVVFYGAYVLKWFIIRRRHRKQGVPSHGISKSDRAARLSPSCELFSSLFGSI